MDAAVRKQFAEHRNEAPYTEADVVLACALLHDTTAAVAAVDWGLELGDAPQRFGLRIRVPADASLAVSDALVDGLCKRSPRVLGVRVMVPRRRFTVHVRFDTALTAAPLCYAPPTTPAHARHADVNWANGGVTAPEDVVLCDALLDTVYNYASVMPRDVRFWYEPIDEHGIMRNAGSAGVVDDSFTSDDTSATTDDAAPPDYTRALGYALCFSGMPDMDGDFLSYIRRKHGARVTAAYVWFPPAGGTSTLVVNMHRAHVVPDATVRRVCAADAKRSRPRDGVSAPTPRKATRRSAPS